MSGAPSPQMQRRYAEAKKTRVDETALARTPLRPTEQSLREHFASPAGRAQTELENPHVEPRLDPQKRASATAASVLLPIVLRESEPTILITKRPPGISFPGHWVFPGGRADETDTDPVETALREAEEEVGLDRAQTEVIGRLGDYYSHSGFRIAPVVALVDPAMVWRPQPAEVDAIFEIPLSRFTNSASYFIFRFQDRLDRAHFALDFGSLEGEGADRLLTGVTASLSIGLYQELEKTHRTPDSDGVDPATRKGR